MFQSYDDFCNVDSFFLFETLERILSNDDPRVPFVFFATSSMGTSFSIRISSSTNRYVSTILTVFLAVAFSSLDDPEFGCVDCGETAEGVGEHSGGDVAATECCSCWVQSAADGDGDVEPGDEKSGSCVCAMDDGVNEDDDTAGGGLCGRDEGEDGGGDGVPFDATTSPTPHGNTVLLSVFFFCTGLFMSAHNSSNFRFLVSLVCGAEGSAVVLSESDCFVDVAADDEGGDNDCTGG